MSKIIGIDLGTTNSEVAVVKDGKPMIIPVEGEYILPSFVGIGNGDRILVGKAAKNQYILDPENTIRSIKRKMGSNEKVRLGQREYFPQEISAFILKKLKMTAEDFLKEPVEKAVITVPAYFSDAQRQATKEAGEIAGLEVVRIINEPTAASLSYRFDKDKDQRALIYDLGGGTFDVSLVEINSGVVEVLASHGNTHLGGDDFDALLIDCLLKRLFEKKKVDLKSERRAMARIARAAEEGKKTLSDHPYAQVKEEFIARKRLKSIHLVEEISRVDFENMIENLIQSTMNSVDRVLSDAKLSPKDIQEIILVGGSTRIPLVSQMIEKKFYKTPHSEVHPELCVALGAAIQGAIIAEEDIDAVLIDIAPYSLGIEVIDMKLDQLIFDAFSVIIPRNTPIPASKSEVYTTTYDNQDAVRIKVYQGESHFTTKNVLLGEFLLNGIPPAPAGESKIIVKFDYDINGIVHITAKERQTGKEKGLSVSTSRKVLSEEEKEKARQKVATSPFMPSSEEIMLKRARELLKKTGSEEEKRLQMQIKDLEEAIKKGDSFQIKGREEALIELLYELER